MNKRVVLKAGLLLACFSGAFLLLTSGKFNTTSFSQTPQATVNPAGSKEPVRTAVSSTSTVPQSRPVSANETLSRELDPAINPYAGGLHGPGQSSRPWDAEFLQQLSDTSTSAPISFELTEGIVSAGNIKITQTRDGELVYVSGELTQPEQGKFFFLTPPAGSKAGKAAGVVEFWGSKTAYRIEPTGPNAEPELWKRQLDEVVCLTMPLKDEDLAAPQIEEMPPLRPDLVPDYSPDYNSNIVSLQSYPGSSAVLLLDFFGGYTPTWGGVTYPRPNVSNAQIKDLWKRVAEDYMPFNINVTTDLRVYQNAPTASRQRCAFSPTISAMPSGAAGVAYIGSWNWGSDTVCWSIYISGKSGAEVGSHEAGHTVGLGHQGTSSSGYYGGHGSGVTGWAPIMGAGYYQPVVSWAKGEYQDANNHEDELNMITTQNNSVAYRPDDTGNTLATSRYLEVYSGNTASGEGVIERTGDTDSFQFTTSGGTVSLTAAPVGDWANLGISATLANQSETIIASNNPQTSLSATITTSLSAGTYTFRVTGIGRNNPLNSGFTAYSSLGFYAVTGSVAGARLPTRLSIAEHSPNGSLVGTVFPTSTNTSLLYAIVSGNTGNTFSIDNRGTIKVANNALLDYARLSTNSMLPVQFQLLVNITDPVNGALTELSRRVVISVLDVNDAPVVTGFSATVLEHTLPGTPVGTLVVKDPDFAQELSLQIVSGDPDSAFGIDNTGLLYIRGDLDRTLRSSYNLAVVATDSAAGSNLSATGNVSIVVASNGTPFRTGAITYAAYDNTGSGTLVTDLTSNGRWPRDPSFERQMSSFEAPINRANNFGAAMRGYLVPPQTGSYTFWIASDDSSELWISTTTNNVTLSRIAYVNGYTGSRQWTKFATQQSAAVSLTAGQAYYVEARMKEGGGDDNLAIAWRGPATSNQTNIIPALYLAPFPMNFLPHLTGFNGSVRQGAFTGTAVGTFMVSDANTDDPKTFSITSGTGMGLFVIDQLSGVVRVADAAALSAASPGTYTLTALVRDSGPPVLSASASATITLVAADAPITSALRRELWNNIGGGNAVTDLTGNSAYPGRPDRLETLTSFASAVDTADNYGSRTRAYLTPTTSGQYRFFIASDDASSLLMSVDDNSTNAVRIAYVSGWTPINAWNNNGTQMSALRTLVAGQRYYVEAIQKEGSGGDHVEVAWAGPGIVDGNGAAATNVIAASFLTPFDLNYPPRLVNQLIPVYSSVPSGTAIGRVQAQDSSLDTITYQIVGGNPDGVFGIDPTTGIISVLDNSLIASGSVLSFPLTIQAQDSGYGGLFKPLSSQATVTINVQTSTTLPFVWSGAAPSGDWSEPGNWGGAIPPNGSRVIFGYPSQLTNFNNSLTALFSVQMTNGGFDIRGNSVSLSSGINNSGNNTWAVPTRLTAAQTWANSSGTLHISGPITNGGFGLALTANADIRVSGPIAGAGGLSKSGAARLILQGTHGYSGSTSIASAGGTTTALEVGSEDLVLSNSDLTLSGRMDLGSHDATVGALNGSGLIFANDLTRTLTLGANGHSGTFSGALQNSASGSGITMNVVKTGAGTQLLNGANTYSGLTVVRDGVLLASSSQALGSSLGGTVVKPGATLALSNNITIPTEPLTLSGAGVLSSGALRSDAGQNTFNGPITLGGAANIAVVAGRLSLGGAWATAGNTSWLTLDTAQGSTLIISGGIEGGGAITKSGGGVLTFSGTNNYTGVTVINEGTLSLGFYGSLRRSAGFRVSKGAFLNVSGASGGWVLMPDQYLEASGTLVGRTTIRGSILPGVFPSLLNVDGDLNLAGSLTVYLGKTAGACTNDILNCSGLLTAGGVLTVTHTGPDPLLLGDTFTIFKAGSYAPTSFSTLNLPQLSPGLSWDISRLLQDGLLRVDVATPPTIEATYTGGVLFLSWPAEYGDYVLQSQTNGVGPEWLPVPGVLSNEVTVPIDSANSSVLYRLARP